MALPSFISCLIKGNKILVLGNKFSELGQNIGRKVTKYVFVVGLSRILRTGFEKNGFLVENKKIGCLFAKR